MDIKNTLFGLFFIAAGLVVIFLQTKENDWSDNNIISTEEKVNEISQNSSIDLALDRGKLGVNDFDDAFSFSSSGENEATQYSLENIDSEEGKTVEKKVYTISNDFIEIDLTPSGGAIDAVRFLKTMRGSLDTYKFNADVEIPSMALSFEKDGRLRLLNVNYQVGKISNTRIDFSYCSPKGLIVQRSYSLENTGKDPYLINHITTVTNESETGNSINLENLFLNLGTTFAINEKELENYLTVGTFDGKDTKFTPINKVKKNSYASGKNLLPRDSMLIRKGRYDWVSLQNQYFVSLLSASVPVKEVQVFPVEVEGNSELGISCNAAFTFDTLAPKESRSLDTQFYVGPKEYKRLQSLGNYQDKVMQFGWFGFFSKLLLYFMSSIYAFVPNWGWSIVIMTIIIKLLFWPLTAKAAESQKGMMKIQAPMAELKKKYENNPQKLQQETLKLFRVHGVNPLAGCFPILIQMPIFLGLFYMLRTAAELRYESFLWVSDLSQADTIATLGGFPINLFPILMGITMFLQMQIAPISPTADPVQQKIFKFMPFIFLVFLYNFSSGLVIYWTTQNILTIIQQKMIHSRKDPEIVEDLQVSKARPIKAKVKSIKKNPRN